MKSTIVLGIGATLLASCSGKQTKGGRKSNTATEEAERYFPDSR